MAGLDDILRSWQKTNAAFDLHRKIKSSGIYSFAEQIRERNAAITGRQMTSLDHIAKAIMYKPKHDLFYFKSINDWLQKTNIHQQIIPKAFESNFYKAITSQQSIINNLFNVNNSFAFATKSFGQANVLCRATGYLSTSMFYETLKHKDWSAFNEISPYYERVAAITESIKEEQVVTNETLQKFDAILNEVRSQLNVVVAKDKKSFLKSFYNLLNIIGFLIGIYCLYLAESDISNKEAFKQTYAKVEEIKTDIEHHFDSLLNSNLKVRTRINCPIRNKPINNSGIISVLSENELVSVIDSCKKYYLVMYKKETSEYPITGWVLKKHTQSK